MLIAAWYQSLLVQLKNLITCAMYNHTTKSWTAAKEEISAGFKALQFISELTNMR